MNDLEQRKAAKDFSDRWQGKGYEKGESQPFWIDLVEHVLGVPNAVQFIRFEDNVRIDKANGFIDGFIDKTKVLIEQKSITKDLRKAIVQSDGSLLNPFQQAKRYSAELPYDDRPRWIVACNFKSMLVYDMNNPNGEPEEILLKDLAKEYYRLSFLVDSKGDHLKKEEELSFKAGELVGKLYDSFSKEYRDINNEQSQKDLNELCVRLVFCLYSEDAGLFGRKNVFHDYLSKYEDLDEMRKAVIDLFKILDTPLDKRDFYLDDNLNQFPYVNGGLFSNENIEIPRFNREIRETLLAKASDDFDWSEISPTIFGAVFESTLNPETRRAGGMHYTSIENIHKVIDPLFLNELREKLNEAESYKNEKTRNEKLYEFQNYISSLKFLDPACGSGNFLTESYLSLRRLENEMLSVISKGSMMFDMDDTIKVSIQQFYGIEINDFAVKVAKTALWIAEAQMWNETKEIVTTMSHISDFLPLETYNNIFEGNALRIDWNEVVSKNELSYIMGNPPFVGARIMSAAQKEDLSHVFGKLNSVGNLDYVCCWYEVACKYIMNTKIECAFVSTNSICQGEIVPIIWEHLFTNYNIKINFAYKSFLWDSEASIKAHVYCVIVGFAKTDRNNKVLYFDNNYKKVENINGYLVDAPNIHLKNRSNPICNVPKMNFGSMPNDGGFLSNYSKDDKDKIVKAYPNSTKMFRQILGADEFINNKLRYCLWLKDISPSEITIISPIAKAVNNVKLMRENSKREETKNLALSPMLFGEIRQPDTNYLIMPLHTGGNRRYIPVGFEPSSVIVTNACSVIPNADLYIFGVMMSNVHNAWMRVTAGYLGKSYRYSSGVVYNNFPWPTSNILHKQKIENTAKMILEARKKYPNSNLAEMYGEFMYLYPELLKAHQENDKVVMEAYGFNIKITESECVAKLMEMYQELTSKN